MAKGDVSSDYIDVDTGNWNNAKTFSLSKIVQYLVKIDEYRIICEHGSDDIVNEIMMDEQLKTKAKITALYRLIKTSQMLISNSMFALKRGKDREAVIEFAKQLKNMEKIYPLCKKEIVKDSHRGRVSEIKLVSEVYEKILYTLNVINEELLYPLNRANLIFKGGEDDEDPEISKQRVLARMAGFNVGE